MHDELVVGVPLRHQPAVDLVLEVADFPLQHPGGKDLQTAQAEEQEEEETQIQTKIKPISIIFPSFSGFFQHFSGLLTS